MTTFRLRDVNWKAACDAAGHLSASRRSLPAQVFGLAALDGADFETAAALLNQAIRLEPFNPQHRFRRALLFGRFGDYERALRELDKLKNNLPDTPLIDYARAIFVLRAGRPEQARAITGTIETAHPQFAPARFLRAEAHLIIAPRPSSMEKYLLALPSGPPYDAMWADLLVKLILLHPQEGPAQARRHLDRKVSKNSPERTLVEKALARAEASIDHLSTMLAAEDPGSPGESVLLECVADRLAAGSNEEALKTLATLRKTYPQRRSVRSLYDAFLTRLASELSSAGRHEEALRLVERSLREQPQDLIYQQNRAALFTLLREPGPYHESWAELNRHQYRLVLFGAMDHFTLSQIAKTHRLFAQQARGGGKGAKGVFRSIEDEDGKHRLVTNYEEIAADPDVLRQWIHHTAAELIFRHTAMGTTGERLLLSPADRDQAVYRAQGLGKLADSLGILVPEEGVAIARFFAPRWSRMAATAHTRYETLKEQLQRRAGVTVRDGKEGETNPPAELASLDVEADRLRHQHTELLGDLCLICFQWRPEYDHIWVAEEFLEFLKANAAFFDENWIYDLDSEPSYPVRLLLNQIQTVVGIEKKIQLTAPQRKAVIDSLVADLLCKMGNSVYFGFTGTPKERVSRAMAYIDQARTLRAADPDIELAAARILTLGEFFAEAQMALERFRRVAKPDIAWMHDEAEKVAEVLRTRRKEGNAGGRRNAASPADVSSETRENRISEIEREIELSPGSWRLYEEIVRELAVSGRFDDAIQWADRGVAHCLSRSEQLNARGLAIAARGMKKLSEANPTAARVFATRAHEPARRAIEGLAQSGPLDYTLFYLLGQCHLAGGSPDRALESFSAASAVCDRQLHNTVLRHLTGNIDNAYLAVAQSALSEALQEGVTADALEAATSVFARLREPASWLVDFARVFFTSALNRVGGDIPPLGMPAIEIAAPWRDAFFQALAQPEDTDRALALCDLAAAVHPASARAAQTLAERTRALKRQIMAAQALNHAGRLVQRRRFDEVLSYLASLATETASEPRLLRIRALALIGLRRFDEAETVIEQIGEGGGAEVREFVKQYPSICFRQRIAAAQQFLREAKPHEAEQVLLGALPSNPRDEADLAYCRAFARALDGYDLKRKGRDVEAHPRFVAALALVEPFLRSSSGDAGRHIAELYDRLEKEIESHAGR